MEVIIKKTILTILLCSVLVLGLTGCGNTKNESTKKDNIKTENKKTKIGKSVQELYDEVKCSEIEPACTINNGMIRLDTNFYDTGKSDDDDYGVLQYIIALQNKLKFDSDVYQDMLVTSNEMKEAESEYAKVHYTYISGMGLEVVYELK